MIIKRNKKRCYERMIRPNRKNIHEGWQSSDNSEYVLDYEDFSEEKMIEFPENGWLGNVGWEKYRDENWEYLDHQYALLDDKFWFWLTQEFEGALQKICRKYDIDELSIDDILQSSVEPTNAVIVTVSSSYEDEPYYEDLCNALQQSGQKAESQMRHDFKHWLQPGVRP